MTAVGDRDPKTPAVGDRDPKTPAAGTRRARVDRPAPRRSNGLPPDPLWYKDAVIYQVPVRAYVDSDGDGMGDFAGLTERLDYLAELGVTAIWVMPFYPSPGKDDGYDIADYTAVNPDYGTMRDVRTFVREAHRRGIRVITELVCNHTSDQHAWFQRARRAAPGTWARDFYVWSDTPDRYADARIIFKDFEASNWAWDPVAGAYYWHRFYSHQPDLNFDSPRVREAIFRTMDFWLELGVDGLRLDAVPYLFEREGTNGENLPETHAFLRDLRRRIDERWADRMLLAEANQWPEDSVPYFGTGDECHMAFHFPVMPRMFMALRMEDRFPIIDILEQTPPIPDTAQWALFLRNHDELTLEMVTDEERDYMYRVYAGDPQARINLGIRRRLAPLLGNNRRRIELLNGLILSLPGTPVLYYGDEIGMGDNVYLGDRNGVRTPMQWSADRNAGFSSANRQRLYLPVITDPEYHYEAVNVATQQANPTSLLWWMRRVIALRKRHKAFGRGSIEFLHPENRRILAFIRRFEDETLLVVANLSRYAQWTQLDLAAHEGLVPIELFGGVEFPRITREPYLISLGPHMFLWFRLAQDPVTQAMAMASDPPAVAGTDLTELFGAKRSAELADVLRSWARPRRWFRSKARRIRSASIADVVPLMATGRRAALVLMDIQYVDGEPERYALPVAVLRDDAAVEFLAEEPEAAIARLTGEGDRPVVLVDGTRVPEVAEATLDLLGGRRRVRGQAGELVGAPTRAFKALRGPTSEPLPAHPIRAEQSNSSATFGDRIILKLYRSIEDGPNPDLEIGRFLAERGFPNVPRLAGAIEYRRGRTASTVAMAQAIVPDARDLWELTSERVAAFLEHALAEEEEPPALADITELERAGEPAPPFARRLFGTELETARLLGTRTGELHVTLASERQDPAFAPEEITPFHQRALYQSIRGNVSAALDLLQRQRSTLQPEASAAAERLLDQDGPVERILRPLLSTRVGGMRIRVHGDFHLGQVLHTGRDVVIIDFEGEPARPLSERRLKRPALTDVAGMVRSFHYAASGAIIEGRASDGQATNEAQLRRWTSLWYHWSSAAFLAGYREATAGARFLPPDDQAFTILLDALLLQKAAYELRYELNNRPAWVGIPIAGILDLLGAD